MNEDLKLAYNALVTQANGARKLIKYYAGDQPLLYTHERLKQVFDRSTVNFIQNWCAVVIDTTCDRMVLKGWDNPAKDANNSLDEFWKSQYLQTISRQVHKDAIVSGNGFIMLDYVGNELRAFYNSPSQVVVLYQDDDPLEKRLGCKTYFEATTGMSHLNLYYPDRIEKYEYKGEATTETSYTLVEEIPNIFGRVPIIHYRAKSELINVVPLQDAINKTFSDMMVVAEFNAFPQRWMITNADISSLTASPQSIMRIPKGASDEEGTSVGEFGTANLAMYLDTIDKLTNTIAVISRTPKHYFMSTGANISGEALTVMETPLIKKVSQLMESFEEKWLELSSYVVESEDTICTWEPAETKQIATQTNAMKTMKDMGIPLVTILRKFGWGEDEIQQMLADMEEEKAKNADIAETALEMARIRLQQSNNPYVPEVNEQTQVERGEAE